MKKIFALMLAAMVFAFSGGVAEKAVSDNLPEYFRIENPQDYFFRDGTVLFISKMLANGNSIQKTDEFVEKIENGEPVTDFRIAEYATYNMPASENGLEGDLVRVIGTIEEYVKDKSGRDTLLGFKLRQDDGCEWMVACGWMSGGNVVVGGVFGGDPRASIFDGYEQRRVEIYGEYMGYSDTYDLPVIDITAYGGMYAEEDNIFICTGKANIEMKYDGLGILEYIIGADRTVVSNEPYRR